MNSNRELSTVTAATRLPHWLRILLLMPFTIKIGQLHFAHVSWARSLTSFGEEALLLSVGLSLLPALRPRGRRVLGAGLLLLNIYLVLSYLGFLTVGAFFRRGLFARQSLSGTLEVAMAIITEAAIIHAAVLLSAFLVLYAVSVYVWRRASSSFMPSLSRRSPIPKRVLLLGTACYGIVAGLVFPPFEEARRMSLAVTVSSLWPSGKNPQSAPRDGTPAPDEWRRHPADPLPNGNRSKRYNLVIYVMESVRASACSAFGGRTSSTPFLAEMRASGEGTFFERAYSVAARSIKALTSLTLPVYPRMAKSAWSWPPNVRHFDPAESFPSILAENGYLTAFSLNSTLDFDNRDEYVPRIGFDLIEGTDTFVATDDSTLIDRLEQFFVSADSTNQPLFALLLASSGHTPYMHPEYPSDPGTISADAASAEATAFGVLDAAGQDAYLRYLRSIRHQDDVARGIYDYLRRNDRLSDTVFVVLGDHGQVFGEHPLRGGLRLHGDALFEESVWIPLWIRHPNVALQSFLAPVQLIDLPPTLLAMLDISSTVGFVGRNVLSEPRSALFFANFVRWPAFGLLEFPYKLQCFGEAPETAECALYNLLADPRERAPLSAEAPRLESMRDRLQVAYEAILHEEQAFSSARRKVETVRKGSVSLPADVPLEDLVVRHAHSIECPGSRRCLVATSRDPQVLLPDLSAFQTTQTPEWVEVSIRYGEDAENDVVLEAFWARNDVFTQEYSQRFPLRLDASRTSTVRFPFRLRDWKPSHIRIDPLRRKASFEILRIRLL